MIVGAGRLVFALVTMAQRPEPCAVLDLILPTADSMVARVATPRCGPLRLVTVGEPRYQRNPPGTYSPERVFEIAVAWENVSDGTTPLPIRMGVDSAAPVQRGRQLPAFYDRNFYDFSFWRGREMQQPWVFGGASGEAGSLAVGHRSGVQSLVIVTNGHTQGVRIWLRIDLIKKPPYEPFSVPGWHPRRPVPLGDAVTSFVQAAGFPKVRDTTMEFFDARHNLRLFTVRYGEGQDCVGGCFYSTAIGLQVGPKVGWVKLWNYDAAARDAVTRAGDHMYRPAADDAYVLSQEFTDTVAALHWRHAALVDQALLPMVLQSPFVSRHRLLSYTQGLYYELDQALAIELVNLPSVQRDAELLTLLANLPYPYPMASDKAREVLRQRVPELLANPRTSVRTLFVLATLLHPYSDSVLVRTLAAHPNAARNPAILAVLAANVPPFPAPFNRQLLDAVRATPRVKQMVERFLKAPYAESSGWTLLRDDEAGANEDVLLVLANIGHQETMWAASRRLPEEALRRDERPFVPLY